MKDRTMYLAKYYQEHKERILKRTKITNKAWRENHSDHARKYYLKHKTWIIRNCQVCGRFCSKWSKKYCKVHSEEYDLIWHRNHRGN